MSAFLSVVGSYMNPFINVCGVVLMVVIIGNAIKLSVQKSHIIDAMNRKNIKAMINRRTLEVEEANENNTVTPDTIRDYEKRFNTVCSRFNVYVQLIPIFPLLGLLGTVVGLMLEVNGGDIEQMMGSLNVALMTTFSGLIWAIVLKTIVAFSPSKTINDVEIMLDDYDKKLDNSLRFGNFTDGETAKRNANHDRLEIEMSASRHEGSQRQAIADKHEDEILSEDD